MVAHHGFMRGPRVPVIVEACRQGEIPVSDEEETTYYLQREQTVAVAELGMPVEI